MNLFPADGLELTIDPDIIRCEAQCRRKASQRFQCLCGSGLGMNSYKLHFRVFVLDGDPGFGGTANVQKTQCFAYPDLITKNGVIPMLKVKQLTVSLENQPGRL
ncbi:MAG TPA: hypothetical protein VF783_15305, partial [Terriglobales bacterium]